MSLTMSNVPSVDAPSVRAPSLHETLGTPDQTHQNTPLQANMRQASDFRRAKRHSILVRLLKTALPATATLIVVFFAGSAILSWQPSIPELSATVGLENGKLVMDKPKMAGFDKNERAYDVKASKAIQDLLNPDVVELETIDATVPIGTNSYAQVDAGAGTYDTKTEKLTLRESVRVKGARGMDIAMEEANIDMKTGEMTSNTPVNVVSKDTNISANSVEVKDNGKRIIFKQKVRMTITRSQRTSAADAPSQN